MSLVKRLFAAVVLVFGMVSGLLVATTATAAASGGTGVSSTVSFSGVGQVGPVSCVSPTACFVAALPSSGNPYPDLIGFDPSGGSQGEVAPLTIGTGLPTSLSCDEVSNSDVDCGYIQGGTVGYVNLELNLSTFSTSGVTSSSVPASGTYQSIDCPNADECIAVGQASGGSAAPPEALEFNIFNNPSSNYDTQTFTNLNSAFSGISCVSSSECFTTAQNYPASSLLLVTLSVSAQSASAQSSISVDSLLAPATVGCSDTTDCTLIQTQGTATGSGYDPNTDTYQMTPYTLSGTLQGLACTSADACVAETSSGSSGSSTMTATTLDLQQDTTQVGASTTLASGLSNDTGGVSCPSADQCVATYGTSAQLLQITTPVSTTTSTTVNPSTAIWSSSSSNTATATVTVSASSGTNAPTGTVEVEAGIVNANSSVTYTTLCPSITLTPNSSSASSEASCVFSMSQLASSSPTNDAFYTISAIYTPTSGSIFDSSEESSTQFTLEPADSSPYVGYSSTLGLSASDLSVDGASCASPSACVFVSTGTNVSGQTTQAAVVDPELPTGTQTEATGSLPGALAASNSNLWCFTASSGTITCVALTSTGEIEKFSISTSGAQATIGSATPLSLQSSSLSSTDAWRACLRRPASLPGRPRAVGPQWNSSTPRTGPSPSRQPSATPTATPWTCPARRQVFAPSPSHRRTATTTTPSWR